MPDLSQFYGPDGELGTDADYIERILDAQEAELEAAGILADLESEQ